MNRSEGTPSPGPSAAQIVATIALLGDERDVIRSAARERLLRWGGAVLPQVQEGAEAEHVATRLQCRAVLRAFEVRDCLQRFARLELDRGGRRSAPALLEGAVLLSKMVRTFVPDAGELAVRLRREAGALKELFTGRSLPKRARLLAERLHEQFGLCGRDASPVDLDHVMIDRVLERRVGVPVTLSLIYLLVARWAGLSVSGVALPDHFLVRLHGVRPVLVDPYHGGRTVTKADCGRYLRANGYDHVSEHLRNLTDRELLIHYLQALRRAAGRQRRAETQATLGHALAMLETA